MCGKDKAFWNTNEAQKKGDSRRPQKKYHEKQLLIRLI